MALVYSPGSYYFPPNHTYHTIPIIPYYYITTLEYSPGHFIFPQITPITLYLLSPIIPYYPLLLHNNPGALVKFLD